MVKAFKESHAKDLEKLDADRLREAEKKATDDAANTPKHTVLSMVGLTSPTILSRRIKVSGPSTSSATALPLPVWTIGMFQMESCQCIRHTKQTNPCEVGVRHAVCTVTGCGFVIRYQNTSDLEQHYVRGGTDHKELADRLTGMQHLERQERLGSAVDGSITSSHTCNAAPAFTSEKNLLCDMKFVK